MNKNIGIYQQRPQPRPQTQAYPQQPYPQQPYQRAPTQPQNIILPSPPQPQHTQHTQNIRKNMYRGIGMGGVRLN